jgi:hypothetical protein
MAIHGHRPFGLFAGPKHDRPDGRKRPSFPLSAMHHLLRLSPRRRFPARSILLLLICTLLLGISGIAQAAEPRPGVDFTNYDVPLYQQITNRIKAKILARIGEGKNTRDRYFIIPFAYENKGNDPEFSHSFITVIRVLADDRQPKLTAGLKVRQYKNREFEAFTISWLPHDFDTNPHLCVFNGFGSRLIPSWNKCPTSVGHNFNLEQTIKLAVNVKNAVGMWGPYEVTQGGFDLGVQRMRLLDGGTIKYRADDRLTRKDRTAINCFHAIAGLDKLFPNGGLFGTGFKMWGLNGTRRVLIEYKSTAGDRGLLLEPIDQKKDLYGFVYAPTRDARRIFDPFKNASAYRK